MPDEPVLPAAARTRGVAPVGGDRADPLPETPSRQRRQDARSRPRLPPAVYEPSFYYGHGHSGRRPALLAGDGRPSSPSHLAELPDSEGMPSTPCEAEQLHPADAAGQALMNDALRELLPLGHEPSPSSPPSHDAPPASPSRSRHLHSGRPRRGVSVSPTRSSKAGPHAEKPRRLSTSTVASSKKEALSWAAPTTPTGAFEGRKVRKRRRRAERNNRWKRAWEEGDIYRGLETVPVFDDKVEEEASTSSSSSSASDGWAAWKRGRAGRAVRELLGFLGSSSSSSDSSDSSSSSTGSDASSDESSVSWRSRAISGFRSRRRSSSSSPARSKSTPSVQTPTNTKSMPKRSKRRRRRRRRRTGDASLDRQMHSREADDADSVRKRQQAITEYTLLSPIELPFPDSWVGTPRPRLPRETPLSTIVPGLTTNARDRPASRLLTSRSLAPVVQGLRHLRQFELQTDNQDGDLGVHPQQQTANDKELHVPDVLVDEAKAGPSRPISQRRIQSVSQPSTHRTPVEDARAPEDLTGDLGLLTPPLSTTPDGLPSNASVADTKRKHQFDPATKSTSGPANSGAADPSKPAASMRKFDLGIGQHGRCGAWWLDIASPKAQDMRELSKVFPLHPLTIEDVLQQESREKVDVFDRLGYYFIVIRAIDESYFRCSSTLESPPSLSRVLSKESEGRSDGASKEEKQVGLSNGYRNMAGVGDGYEADEEEVVQGRKLRRPRVDILEQPGGKEGVEGVSVGAVNVYLVVFAGGVITFHFEDVGTHLYRLKHRILSFDNPANMTSDWIAHGFLDSIVDAFFPFLSYNELEIDELDELINDHDNKPQVGKAELRLRKALIAEALSGHAPNKDTGLGKELRKRLRPGNGSKGAGTLDEKELFPNSVSASRSSIRAIRPWSPFASLSRLFTRRRRRPSTRSVASAPSISLPEKGMQFVGIKASGPTSGANQKIEQGALLRRITDTKKLVVGISRLLAPKGEMVRGLKKRLAENTVRVNIPGMGRSDVHIYMGDIDDHIVTMQQNLIFHDATLMHLHSAYLSRLRMFQSTAQAKSARSLMLLSYVTLNFIAIAPFVGIFSMNVHVPHNGLWDTHLEPDGSVPPHTWFFILLGIVCLVACSVAVYFITVRRLAKRKWTRVAQGR